MHRSFSVTLAATAAIALLLTGCATPAGSSSAPTDDNRISVVTSTNVYGDIVKAVGGDKVTVNAIISKTSQDPHSYEASAQDKLQVSKAKLVVENGGGYDGFLHKLADDANVDHDNIVSAVEVSGLAPEGVASHTEGETSGTEEHHHDHGDFNEHVWYNLDAMAALADALAGKLSTLDAASASTFTANAEAFKASLGELRGRLDEMKKTVSGTPVVVSELVPVYLLESAGLENKTPEAFTTAIEEGTDVPPSVLKETEDLAGSQEVRLLAYNNQTEGTQTEAVKRAAIAGAVPVVDFTETLPDGISPDGKGYVQWMKANVENISKALGL
ncbi:metal ABC transporter solute-binding protein, Zn/Mn family [Arthrobacter sp. ISL-30]|uniref:metal ABC transporter solute-binding protein, Zn/Mn family n=1 Tax=Arthrobacter sp. ISL-30 TaxID=2819109 RepID=UPI001BE8DB64|nr:zinc ABC transporter substrate-binding protein [Arthrobacter sp. ISL-30]MBT2513926.1 zinc ABC transporter substrate-binding protein [Arthrobacter sp. ISL-30]